MYLMISSSLTVIICIASSIHTVPGHNCVVQKRLELLLQLAKHSARDRLVCLVVLRNAPCGSFSLQDSEYQNFAIAFKKAFGRLSSTSLVYRSLCTSLEGLSLVVFAECWLELFPTVGVHDNDNDNDTLKEVPHPSNEGLALQARVSGPWPLKKRICFTGRTCSLARCANTNC